MLPLAEGLLSEKEMARAGHFRFGRHRRRFVLRRAMRRIVLAELTGLRPKELCFAESGHGKPHLADISTAIEFNSSHSGDRGVIATGNYPLGVDIEALERPMDYLRFARHSFADEEYIDIRRCSENDRRVAFFNCWTGKEAYIKSLGLGLSKKLSSFAVRCAPEDPPGLKWDEEQLQDPGTCSFLRYTDDNHVATMVLNRPSETLNPTLHELSALSIRELKPIKRQSGPRWRKYREAR